MYVPGLGVASDRVESVPDIALLRLRNDQESTMANENFATHV